MDSKHWGAETYEARHAAAWARFGRMIRRWRTLNGWTQYLGEQIQKELGIPSLIPSNWSNIENGKAGQMKPTTFWKLAELNSRVHHNDWPPIHSRQLKDWLADSKAIVNEHGEPWGPSEFFACATGETKPPAWLEGPQAPEISDREASRLCEEWSDRWRALKAEHQIPVRAALEQVCAYVPASERDLLSDVLNGDQVYTAEQLMAGWDGEWVPEVALRQWKLRVLHTAQRLGVDL